jgi:hypothetical protein
MTREMKSTNLIGGHVGYLLEIDRLKKADKRIDKISSDLARQVINSDLCRTASDIALRNIERQRTDSKREIRL